MVKQAYSVFWTDIAHKDLEDIIDYISNDSNSRAVSVFNQIKNKVQDLNRFPERGLVVPELKFHSIENYRELVVSPWRIIYRIADRYVYILAVFDGRRNIEDIIMQRVLFS